MADDNGAAAIVKELAEASHEDASRILAEENAGSGRKSVVEAALARLDELDGVPAPAKGEEKLRRDAHGRILNAWETGPGSSTADEA